MTTFGRWTTWRCARACPPTRYKEDTREIKSEAAQHSAATAEGDMMEINRVDEESVMNNTTEVVEPGSGTVVMTPTYGSKDQDKLLFVAEPLLEPLEHSGDDPSQVEGEARLLAYPRIAVHLEELAPNKPKVLLSCKESTEPKPTMENGKKKNKLICVINLSHAV